MWGPTGADSAAYLKAAAQLGAGTYLTTIRWADVAPSRPGQASDPADPAYVWPAGFDATVASAAAAGMRVFVNLTSAPAWASGAASSTITPPRDPAEFAAFAAAASRKYPQVRGWQIWSEPMKPTNWAGLPGAISPWKPLGRAGRAVAEHYAAMLDASYAALHAIDGDTVIGGNSWTAGQISPYQWIRALRLPNGKRPRMDAYGHNPFSARAADLTLDARIRGTADICDLDDLEGWLDRWQRRPGRGPLPVWLSEFAVPSGGPSADFNFFVTDRTGAAWTRAALRLVRSHPRIQGIAWVALYDATGPDGATTTGLIRADGARKPAFAAFARG